MKKTLCAVMALLTLLLASLAGCSGGDDTAKDNAEAVEAVLSHYISDAAEQLKHLCPTCYNNILNNITCPGLESSGKKVLFQSKGKAK